MTFNDKWSLGGRLNFMGFILSMTYWPLKAVGAFEFGVFCSGASVVLIGQGICLMVSAIRMPVDAEDK